MGDQENITMESRQTSVVINHMVMNKKEKNRLLVPLGCIQERKSNNKNKGLASENKKTKRRDGSLSTSN